MEKSAGVNGTCVSATLDICGEIRQRLSTNGPHPSLSSLSIFKLILSYQAIFAREQWQKNTQGKVSKNTQSLHDQIASTVLS